MRILIPCLFLLWFFPGSGQNPELPSPIPQQQTRENPETTLAQALGMRTRQARQNQLRLWKTSLRLL